MSGVLERIKADGTHPLGNQSGVMPRREVLVRYSPPLEQALSRRSVASLEIDDQRLARHFGQLEANRAAGLALPNTGAVKGVAVGGHIVHAKRHQIAPAQLAVDRQIEERQVADAPLQMQH